MRSSPMVATNSGRDAHLVAIAGNPNAGKTALFNLLTGANQKIANFPGVTVEKKEGSLRDTAAGLVTVIDLPGTYSLDADTPDERIAQQILLGLHSETRRPDAIVVVADATHLERSLFLTSQLMEYGVRLVFCLNMYDVAQSRGMRFDLEALSRRIGAPVVPTVAIKGTGRSEVIKLLGEQAATLPDSVSQRPFSLSPETEEWRRKIAADLTQRQLVAASQADFWAGRILSGRWREFGDEVATKLRQAAEEWQKTLPDAAKIADLTQTEIRARHDWSAALCREVIVDGGHEHSLSDRIDRFVLNPFFGPMLFIAVMAVVFQSVFTWATPLMDLLDSGVNLLKSGVVQLMPESIWRSLVVDGALSGVGSVVVFLPQIMILFLFIGLLEDSGYLARAAFLVDRLMVRSGLSGKSFIPLLSSFACAIPGIMATRTIKNERDRLATIMVAPLMTCSARLPVYALLIGSFVPTTRFFGLRLQGITLLGLYLLGMLGAVVAAKVLRRTLLRGPRSMLILELPDYKVPNLRNIGVGLWLRSKLFLQRAGKIILAISIVLWFLSSFPREAVVDSTTSTANSHNSSESLRHSYAGKIGSVLEPVLQPLGYDWKIGVGLLASFAAREVFVATLGTLYNVADADENSESLRHAITTDVNSHNGQPLFNFPMVAGLLVFFAFAMQCVSTVAIMRRETNGWKWPLLAVLYTYVLAYVCAFATYQGLSWFRDTLHL